MKKQLNYLLIAVAITLLAIPAMAANTITASGNVITITSIDSDWTWSDTISSTDYPYGIKLVSITFVPGAASDRCIVKEGSDSGPPFFDSDEMTDNDPRGWPYHQTILKPMLDVSAGTYSAGSKVIIIWQQKGRSY